MLDLFHHLLRHDELSGVQILKFNVKGGPDMREIVSGLRVYTAIFEHYEICEYSIYNILGNINGASVTLTEMVVA